MVKACAVVLTTGTFMRGLMHTGESKTQGGRFGEAAAVGISGALQALGFELGRLKTGTPPRLKKSTIDWEGLPAQWGDEPPAPFSELSEQWAVSSEQGTGNSEQGIVSREQKEALQEPEIADDRASDVDGVPAHCSLFPAHFPSFPPLPQLECRQTRTTGPIHDLIRANLHRAPMYSGQIGSVGPRYCPSIEDKVVKFADRGEHHVFLEPESLRDDWIYCNGISTSLPADVQDLIVRGMPGCERAEIYRYGYAVEYDMVRPHQIGATGMTKLVDGLFLAGQINGTSGYEEAAGQGLVAGINAARHARGEGEFILGRDQAYIGVMMDDLVCKTPVEPYRMFTSRAEHRLLLRADNAPDRLTPLAESLGLLASTDLGRRRSALFAERRRSVAALDAAIGRAKVSGEPLAQILRRSEFTLDDLRAALPDAQLEAAARNGVWATVFADRKYEAYLVRQRAEIKRQAELEGRRLPAEIEYETFGALRTEARAALVRFRPQTFGQAGRLEGITPADLTLLSVLVKRWGGGGGSASGRQSTAATGRSRVRPTTGDAAPAPGLSP